MWKWKGTYNRLPAKCNLMTGGKCQITLFYNKTLSIMKNTHGTFNWSECMNHSTNRTKSQPSNNEHFHLFTQNSCQSFHCWSANADFSSLKYMPVIKPYLITLYNNVHFRNWQEISANILHCNHSSHSNWKQIKLKIKSLGQFKIISKRHLGNCSNGSNDVFMRWNRKKKMVFIYHAICMPAWK